MQPENTQPSTTGQEQFSPPPTFNGERIPSLPPIETGIEIGAERREQIAEAGARVADTAGVATPVVMPQVPQVAPSQQNGATTQGISTTGPLVAADEDLIEKEWVDKAKEIIQHTKDDPHTRTQKVNELQRDYLKKRYGRVVGSNE